MSLSGPPRRGAICFGRGSEPEDVERLEDGIISGEMRLMIRIFQVTMDKRTSHCLQKINRDNLNFLCINEILVPGCIQLWIDPLHGV